MKNSIKRILKEYVTSDIISLRNYLNMSEEDKKRYLPREYYWFFDDFLIEEDYEDYEKPDDYEGYELIEWLEKNDKNMYDRFADYLYNKIIHFNLPIDDSEYPSWAYLDEGEIVKNQWLIHFTNDADDIAKDGFTKGVDEISKLGLTRFLSDFDKKYGGYNFGYDLRDYLRYGRSGRSSYGSHGFKYGDEAVIFRASGIKSYHGGDLEPQVIFYGNTAKNIIPITRGDKEDWAVYDIRNGRLFYESDSLEKVVDWVVKNYDQYRSRLYIR